MDSRNVLQDHAKIVVLDASERVRQAEIFQEKGFSQVKRVIRKWVPARNQKIFWKKISGTEIQIRRVVEIAIDRYILVSEDERWYDVASLEEVNERMSFYKLEPKKDDDY